MRETWEELEASDILFDDTNNVSLVKWKSRLVHGDEWRKTGGPIIAGVEFDSCGHVTFPTVNRSFDGGVGGKRKMICPYLDIFILNAELPSSLCTPE